MSRLTRVYSLRGLIYQEYNRHWYENNDTFHVPQAHYYGSFSWSHVILLHKALLWYIWLWLLGYCKYQVKKCDSRFPRTPRFPHLFKVYMDYNAHNSLRPSDAYMRRKLTIIGSDNGLSPGRRQAIIWTSAGILLIGPLGTNFSQILIGIQFFFQEKALENVVCEITSILSRTQCVKWLRVLLSRLSGFLIMRIHEMPFNIKIYQTILSLAPRVRRIYIHIIRYRSPSKMQRQRSQRTNNAETLSMLYLRQPFWTEDRRLPQSNAGNFGTVSSNDKRRYLFSRNMVFIHISRH